ncbi:MAG: ATP-binding protein [Thiohalomonadales bacterium]
MTNFLNKLSIKNRLTWIIFLTSGSIVSATLIAILFMDLANLHQHSIHEARNKSKILNQDFAKMVLFGDLTIAADASSKLREYETVLNAFVYDTHGDVIFSYSRSPELRIEPPSLLKNISYIKEDILHVFSPIKYVGTNFGSVYLRINPEYLSEKRKEYYWLFGIGLPLILILSYTLALWLQTYFTRPIIAITRQMETISVDQDYTVDLKTQESHEIFSLYQSFSRLLKTIHSEKCKLQESRDQLASNEAKFRGVLENAANGILLINGAGKIELVNSALLHMLGYEESELINQPLELLVPDRYEQHGFLREKFVKTGRQRRMADGLDIYALRKDGSEFPIEVSLTPVKTDKGKIVAAMIQNITDRKLAEHEKETLLQSLANKNAELERFTYTASHDLKSPLVTISGFIGLLKKDIAANDKVRVDADLTRISNAAMTMQELLDDLLALSRIGRKPMPCEWLPLNSLVDSVLDMLAVQISNSEISINVDENLPSVYVQEPRIKEVYLNLIENAIKYRRHDVATIIDVGMRESEKNKDMKVFLVRDNGLGIESRYHNKIFDLFERLDNHSEGTGIGLAIVKRIIEVHEGEIWVESQGLGFGTTFCFELPQIDSQQARSIA